MIIFAIGNEFMSNEKEIFNRLSELAKSMFANGGGDVWLYGSRASGTALKDSDWDILVVTDDNISTNDNFISFAFPFAEIGWHYGAQITPIHYTRSQWNAERATAFYDNVVSNSIHL